MVGLLEMGLNPGLSGHKAPPWIQVFAPSFPMMGHPLRVLHAATVLGCPVLVVLSHAPAMLVWDPVDWLWGACGKPSGAAPNLSHGTTVGGCCGGPPGRWEQDPWSVQGCPEEPGLTVYTACHPG